MIFIGWNGQASEQLRKGHLGLRGVHVPHPPLQQNIPVITVTACTFTTGCFATHLGTVAVHAVSCIGLEQVHVTVGVAPGRRPTHA